MDELKKIYNKDIKSYKKFLKEKKINYKKLIKYFSQLKPSEDERFEPNMFFLPRKKDFGFVKLCIKNNSEEYEYFVSAYQTTNSQFNTFLINSNYKCKYKYPKNDHNHPVTWVTWHDAIAYCEWLNKSLKSRITHNNSVNLSKDFKNLINDNNYQICLLSEKEWLYAATLDKNIYPWGNKVSVNCCNFKTSKLNKTCPVGCYIEGISENGLFDLSGNTWEWLRTKWGPRFEERKYKKTNTISDDRDNIYTEKKFLRAMKGGSFAVEYKRLKINFEDAVTPESSDDADGFRIGIVKLS